MTCSRTHAIHELERETNDLDNSRRTDLGADPKVPIHTSENRPWMLILKEVYQNTHCELPTQVTSKQLITPMKENIL